MLGSGEKHSEKREPTVVDSRWIGAPSPTRILLFSDPNKPAEHCTDCASEAHAKERGDLPWAVAQIRRN